MREKVIAKQLEMKYVPTEDQLLISWQSRYPYLNSTFSNASLLLFNPHSLAWGSMLKSYSYVENNLSYQN